jgi:hypothetical protein
VAQSGKEIDCCWYTEERVDQPVGIDQIRHGRVMGRVPSSRPR